LAALSGLLSRLLLLLLTRLLLAAALLATTLAALLVLLVALILIILGHSYLPNFCEVLLECYYSTNSLELSHNATNARGLEKKLKHDLKHDVEESNLPKATTASRILKDRSRDVTLRREEGLRTMAEGSGTSVCR
jgi:hypothetical protein